MISPINFLFLTVLATTLCILAWQSHRFFQKSLIARLHQDCRGASYSISMILILPFYLTIFVGAIEANWMFHANTLFQRASMMAGRSVSVTYQQEFEEHENDSKLKLALEQNGELAATLVLFSGGSGLPEQALRLSPEETEFVKRFLAQLEKTTEFSPNGDTRLRAEYVVAATTVALKTAEDRSENITDRLKLTLEYEHPFFSQVIGRFFGHPSHSGDVYVRTFTKEIEIPMEVARSDNHKLGIK